MCLPLEMQEVSTSKSSPAHSFPNLPGYWSDWSARYWSHFQQPYQRQTLSTCADEGMLLESLRVYLDRISMRPCSNLSGKQLIVGSLPWNLSPCKPLCSQAYSIIKRGHRGEQRGEKKELAAQVSVRSILQIWMLHWECMQKRSQLQWKSRE